MMNIILNLRNGKVINLKNITKIIAREKFIYFQTNEPYDSGVSYFYDEYRRNGMPKNEIGSMFVDNI